MAATSDKSLTASNVIRLLRERQFRFSKNWRGVASGLGVSLEKRAQQEHQLTALHLEADFSVYFEETIDDWLRNSDDPTWTKLIRVIALFDRSVARDLKDYLGLPQVTMNVSVSVDDPRGHLIRHDAITDDDDTTPSCSSGKDINKSLETNSQLVTLLKSMTLEDPQQIQISCKVFNADTNQLIQSTKGPITRDIKIRPRPTPRVQEFSSDTVKVGTSIRLEITADCDCYMYILNIGTSGKMSLLLPNQYETSHFFRANEIYYLPGKDFGFEIDGPAGKETIQVLGFSIKQSILDKLLQSSSKSEPDEERVLYRDIVIKRKAAQTSEQKGFALIQFDVQL